METEHWIQYFTDVNTYGSEIPYYYNKETHSTQWEEPEEMTYYYYARHESKSEEDQEKLLPDDLLAKDMDSVLEYIGVDSISHLQCNSIRRLHIYHQGMFIRLFSFQRQ